MGNELIQTAPAPSWFTALRAHARAHSLAAMGLGLALMMVLDTALG